MKIPEKVYNTIKDALVEHQDDYLALEALDWLEAVKNAPREWKVGDEIHGFANGYFGRDSYDCRRVVSIIEGNVLVLKNTRGNIETISIKEANLIHDPMDMSDCDNEDWECGLREY